VWDGPGKDRWADDLSAQHLIDHGTRMPIREAFERCPAEPPPGWRPDESMPCWEFCDKSHPAALRVYICEERERVRA
jgi:hypothetical protein